MYKFLLSVVCVAGLNAQMVAGVALVVKDKAITLYDIEKHMRAEKVDQRNAISILVRQKLEIIEVEKRKITVNNSEVYDDIKMTAKRNKMSVDDLYEAALNSRGTTSKELKEQVRQKLLSQKLYRAIAYSKIKLPSDSEVEEYFKLNKTKFVHPASFTTVVYQAKTKEALQQKVKNPMFYSPEIATKEQVLPYDKISPELAGLLSRTALNTFTPIVPDGRGGYMSFYVKSIESAKEAGLEAMSEQIKNIIMGEKREKVLKEYFARLRHNIDIKELRKLP